MSKTKTIYFLSAIVLIIGCYALNLSYSMFVQTEEREIVESIVPSLKHELSIPSITLKENDEYIIKQTIKNTGTVSMNYALVATYEGATIRLVDYPNNELTGTIEAGTSRYIYLYLKNDTSEDVDIKFSLLSTYTTLNNTNNSNIDNTTLYTVKKTAIPYYDKENTLAYNIMNNYALDKDVEDSLLTNEELDFLSSINNTIKLPIYNDNIVDPNTGNIYKTNDNTGITYYYKDNLDNNYVSINNIMFRIMRINGNGTIRLISNDSIGKYVNNESKAVLYDNSVKDTINNWYTANLEKYSDLLSDEVFCITNKDTYDISNDLICNEDNIYTVSNEKLLYPIATITLDDLVLAGLNSYIGNDNILTMTSYKDKNVFVLDNGKLNTNIKDKEYDIKVVINLKNDLSFTGSGLITDPYKVVEDVSID